MFYVPFSLSLTIPVILYALSNSTTYGKLSRSALHPFNVVAFMLMVINLNFLWCYLRLIDDEPVYFARFSFSSFNELYLGYLYFIVSALCIVAGIALGSNIKTKKNLASSLYEEFRAKSAVRVLTIAFISTGLTSVIVVKSALDMGGLFYVAMTRQVFLSENAYLVPLYSVLVPAFVIWCSFSKSSLLFKMLLAAFAIALLLPIGSRSSLFYIAVCLITLVAARSIRIPVFSLYVLAPLSVPILVTLRYFREYSNQGSFSQFLDAREGQLLFGGADFQFAEPIVYLVNNDVLQRYPLETFVAGLLAYVPRSLFPLKPEGPSTELTMLSDLQRWELVQSEWIIGGLANLYVELGPFFALLVLFLVSLVWARILKSSASRGSIGVLVSASSFCSITAFLFLRV